MTYSLARSSRDPYIEEISRQLRDRILSDHERLMRPLFTWLAQIESMSLPTYIIDTGRIGGPVVDVRPEPIVVQAREHVKEISNEVMASLVRAARYELVHRHQVDLPDLDMLLPL